MKKEKPLSAASLVFPFEKWMPYCTACFFAVQYVNPQFCRTWIHRRLSEQWYKSQCLISIEVVHVLVQQAVLNFHKHADLW